MINPVKREENWNVAAAPQILIVDDEPGLIKLFSSLIKRMNCQSLQAIGGAAALDILSRETPDVLILDLAMPHISGFDVLQYVRATPRLNAMKVIILTARPNMVYEVEELGISCWLSKPITPRDFISAVEEVMGEGS